KSAGSGATLDSSTSFQDPTMVPSDTGTSKESVGSPGHASWRYQTGARRRTSLTRASLKKINLFIYLIYHHKFVNWRWKAHERQAGHAAFRGGCRTRTGNPRGPQVHPCGSHRAVGWSRRHERRIAGHAHATGRDRDRVLAGEPPGRRWGSITSRVAPSSEGER